MTDRTTPEFDPTSHDETIDITAVPWEDTQILRLPGDGLLETVSGSVQSTVSDILLYEYPHHENISEEIQGVRRSLLTKILFFTKDEWNLIQKELLEIGDLLSNNHWSITDQNFIRSYEGFAVLKQIQCIIDLKSVKIDYRNVAKYFREGLSEEPDRKNILGLLLSCIVGSEIIEKEEQ